MQFVSHGANPAVDDRCFVHRLLEALSQQSVCVLVAIDRLARHGRRTGNCRRFLLRAFHKTLGLSLSISPLSSAFPDQSEISPDSEKTYGVLGTDSLTQKTYGKPGLESKNGGFLAESINVWSFSDNQCNGAAEVLLHRGDVSWLRFVVKSERY